MTVRHVSGVIFLEGDCGVEEAEPLLQALAGAPEAVIDWTACARLHTAVLQVILAAKAPVIGRCGDTWLDRWASRLLRR